MGVPATYSLVRGASSQAVGTPGGLISGSAAPKFLIALW